MSEHTSDPDARDIPRNDVRQHFEFLMLHPPQLRKHVLKLRLLSTIGLLPLSSGRPGPKCRDLLLHGGPAVAEVSEEMLRQVLCDEVTLLNLHDLIWRGEAGAYWSEKIENQLDAEAGLELDPEVDARIKATVAARVREAFSEDPVAVSNERTEWSTADTSRPRAIARQSLEVQRSTASDSFSFSWDGVTAFKDNEDLLIGDTDNALTLGYGNDMVYVGDGANTVVFGNGNDHVHAGNYSNILIEGSVQLTQSSDLLRQELDDWIAYGVQAANVANIRSRLLVTCNTHCANTLRAGSGLDWFWAMDTLDNMNVKKIDLRN